MVGPVSFEACDLQADRAGTEPRVASTATNTASTHEWGALDSSHSSCWYLSRAGLITDLNVWYYCYQSYTLNILNLWGIMLGCGKKHPKSSWMC